MSTTKQCDWTEQERLECEKETNDWFDGLPQITEEELDELERVDRMRYKGIHEL